MRALGHRAPGRGLVLRHGDVHAGRVVPQPAAGVSRRAAPQHGRDDVRVHVADSATDAYWMLPMMGFAQLAVFAGYSIYFPELFPTRLRGTGVGFCYNTVRYLAAPAPILLGYLATLMSFREAAVLMSSVYVDRHGGADLGAGDARAAAARGLTEAAILGLRSATG